MGHRRRVRITYRTRRFLEPQSRTAPLGQPRLAYPWNPEQPLGPACGKDAWPLNILLLVGLPRVHCDALGRPKQGDEFATPRAFSIQSGMTQESNRGCRK